MTYLDMPYIDRELPSFTLRQLDLPEVTSWSIGDEYYLVMKVELTGKHNQESLEAKEDKPKLEARFKVKSIRALGNKPIDAKSIERDDFNKTVAKVKSGEY